MSSRRSTSVACACAIAVMTLVASRGTAQAEDEQAGAGEPAYRRLSLSLNLPYLALQLVQLHAELALSSRWSAALRGGAGKSGIGHDQWLFEVGGQAGYYVLGTVDRGMQVGLDARAVGFEGDGYLLSLGDGLAIGPFVGYKRVFGAGLTLGAQLGVQGIVFGEREDAERGESRVLPYLLLHAGWSLLPTRPMADDHERAPREVASRAPLDEHEGFVAGASIGGGLASLHGCDACELEPGLAVAAYLGWFVHRRVALVVDTNAAVAVFSLSSGFGSFGFGLTGLGAQYWLREELWLKATVGVAQMVSLGVGGPGSGVDVGGGMTVAAGWELHQSNGFTMDLQARISHGEFDTSASDPIDGAVEAVDTFAATFGLNWQ